MGRIVPRDTRRTVRRAAERTEATGGHHEGVWRDGGGREAGGSRGSGRRLRRRNRRRRARREGVRDVPADRGDGRGYRAVRRASESAEDAGRVAAAGG